jgi:hypothetical protein
MEDLSEHLESLIAVCGENGIDDHRILAACKALEEHGVWSELDRFFEKHRQQYNLSFGLEYSSVVDWVADITPRRGHPQARDYPLWQASSWSREDAVRLAIQAAKEAIEPATD